MRLQNKVATVTGANKGVAGRSPDRLSEIENRIDRSGDRALALSKIPRGSNSLTILRHFARDIIVLAECSCSLGSYRCSNRVLADLPANSPDTMQKERCHGIA